VAEPGLKEELRRLGSRSGERTWQGLRSWPWRQQRRRTDGGDPGDGGAHAPAVGGVARAPSRRDFKQLCELLVALEASGRAPDAGEAEGGGGLACRDEGDRREAACDGRIEPRQLEGVHELEIEEQRRRRGERAPRGIRIWPRRCGRRPEQGDQAGGSASSPLVCEFNCFITLESALLSLVGLRIWCGSTRTYSLQVPSLLPGHKRMHITKS
jgi:hypothetical protein